jgi:hypothetical protein
MPRLSRSQKEQIAKALEDEQSPTEIAKEMGIARSSVYRLMKAEPATQRRDTNSDDGSAASVSTNGREHEDDGDDEDDNDPVVRFRAMASTFASDLGLKEQTQKPHIEEETSNAATAARMEQVKRAEEIQRRRIEAELTDGSPRLEVREAPTREEFSEAKLRRTLPPQFASQFDMLSDPDFDRGQVIQQIMFNVEHFAPMIRKIIGEDAEVFVQSLPQRSDRELEGLLSIIDRTRSVGNMATTMRHTFYMAANGAEIITNQFLNMRTRGYLQALQAQDTEISMAIKELAIEHYNKFSKMNRPEMRLGLLAVMTLVQLDSTNRIKEAMGNVPPVPTETAEKYNDL